MSVNNIPIFIHHETGEKPQAGKDKKQEYLKLCINQAEKYDNDVFLFGDNGNKGWANKWLNINEIKPNKWKQFVEVFENYSTYPEAWAKGIFHRFFLFEEYAKKNNIKSFFVLDSDVLVYANLESLYDWSEVDFAATMLKSNQLGNDIENEFRWTINVGVSYWTLAALEDFTSYCIEIYKNKKDILLPKWEFHKKNNYPGGICEMTLIYLWNKESSFRKINLVNTVIEGGVFNHDINGSENFSKDDFQIDKLIGIKKIKSNKGRVVAIDKNGGEIRLYNIHFVGDTKILMADFFYYGKIKKRTFIVYLFYNSKKQIGLIYRKIKRKLDII